MDFLYACAPPLFTISDPIMMIGMNNALRFALYLRGHFANYRKGEKNMHIEAYA